MRLKTTSIVLLTGLIAVLANACYYDVEEEIYPSTECNTEDVTYSESVIPILQENCYECHSIAENTAGITLEGYNNITQYVNSGELLGVINHDPSFPPMPQGAPQLVDCNIAKIEQWVADGAPDN